MTMIANHLPTAELQKLDAAHHMHPFTSGNDLAAKGVRVITQASGVTLTDSNGEQILDGMAGLWCVNVGYGRKELVDAATAQMTQLPFYNTFFQTTHVPALSLAAQVASLAPGDLNNVFFAGSGSEANDTNIRLIRHYWASRGKPEKSIFISRMNAYHGSSMGSGSLGGMTVMHEQGGLPIADIVHIGQPHWYAEGGDMDPAEFGLMRARELEAKIAELGENRVAAFIAEPIQGAGGVIIPPETYWPEIQRICDAHEILLVADEVICGFGRTGNWFGSQSLNIKPDVMTVAKGITSGYLPLGASIVSDEIVEVINDAGEFAHGYTYSGHPVACAVALENLRIIAEEGIIDHVRDVAGPHLARKWSALEDHPMVGEARSFGMMGSVALSPDKASRAPFSRSGVVGTYCRDACFENGLVMRAVGDRMIIAPPLVMTPSEIDTLADRALRAIDIAYGRAKSEGLM